MRFPSGFCYIVSVTNLDRNTTGGSTAQVSVALAAKSLVEGTHNLLDDDEIRAFEAAELDRRKLIAQADGQRIRRQMRNLLGDNH